MDDGPDHAFQMNPMMGDDFKVAFSLVSFTAFNITRDLRDVFFFGILILQAGSSVKPQISSDANVHAVFER